MERRLEIFDPIKKDVHSSNETSTAVLFATSISDFAAVEVRSVDIR
ncbi:hypothetical protein CEV33_2999 [Brucella grignonensis]|uniref:Uncharacterized protein n=1 Tax=Brucella grignonensis TaxID=94627 RepID=A0A256F1H4_9HYPH|nr:hypothetical protein CEV33_2999 [Brucella grignonensis]